MSLSSLRRQRGLEQCGSHSLVPVPKEQKHDHSGNPWFPPQFYDNLSQLHLTSNALQEHTRRSVHEQRQQPIALTSAIVIPAIDYLRHCGQEVLKKIKQTARHGGPDLSDLRHFSPILDQAMSSQLGSRVSKRRRTSTSVTKTSPKPTASRKTGPYDRNFEQHLVDNNIYPPRYKFPDGRVLQKPNNFDEIIQRLNQPRPELSPSRFSPEDHEEFIQAISDAAKEKQVTTFVMPIIEGKVEDARCVSGGIPFNNLDHLTDGNLRAGNPDIYYGARPEQLQLEIRDELGSLIIPSTQTNLPICANFVVALKGPDGKLSDAIRQATYDGALAARAVNGLKTHFGEKKFDDNAYAITCVFHCGILRMYVIYQHQIDGKVVYSTHSLGCWAMEHNLDTFRAGATAYRNGRDWAKQQRDEAIQQGNTKFQGRSQPPPAVDVINGGSTIQVRSSAEHSVTEETNTTTEPQQTEVQDQELKSNDRRKRHRRLR